MRVVFVTMFLALALVGLAFDTQPAEKSDSPREGVKYTANASRSGNTVFFNVVRYDDGKQILVKDYVTRITFRVTNLKLDVVADDDVFLVIATVRGFIDDIKVTMIIKKEFNMVDPKLTVAHGFIGDKKDVRPLNDVIYTAFVYTNTEKDAKKRALIRLIVMRFDGDKKTLVRKWETQTDQG